MAQTFLISQAEMLITATDNQKEKETAGCVDWFSLTDETAH